MEYRLSDSVPSLLARVSRTYLGHPRTARHGITAIILLNTQQALQDVSGFHSANLRIAL